MSKINGRIIDCIIIDDYEYKAFQRVIPVYDGVRIKTKRVGKGQRKANRANRWH